MAVIIALSAALVPALSSISKSGGRKAALSNLLNAIEQARTQAVRDGQATYLVFPTFGTTNSRTDPYNYRSYAIFEDDPATNGVKQLTNWKTLPVGIALRAKSSAALSNLTASTALPSPTPSPSFSFNPNSSASPTYYLIKFNSAGEIELPNNNITMGVFEGLVTSSGNETVTSQKDSNGRPSAAEYLFIAQHTGRAIPTASPSS